MPGDHKTTICKTRPDVQHKALELAVAIADFMADADEFLGAATFYQLKAVHRELQDIANGIR